MHKDVEFDSAYHSPLMQGALLTSPQQSTSCTLCTRHHSGNIRLAQLSRQRVQQNCTPQLSDTGPSTGEANTTPRHSEHGKNHDAAHDEQRGHLPARPLGLGGRRRGTPLTADPESEPASGGRRQSPASAAACCSRLCRSSSWMRAMTPTKRAWKASPPCVLAICCTSAITIDTIACKESNTMDNIERIR
jgi:hypothetical protein